MPLAKRHREVLISIVEEAEQELRDANQERDARKSRNASGEPGLVEKADFHAALGLKIRGTRP